MGFLERVRTNLPFLARSVARPATHENYSNNPLAPALIPSGDPRLDMVQRLTRSGVANMIRGQRNVMYDLWIMRLTKLPSTRQELIADSARFDQEQAMIGPRVEAYLEGLQDARLIALGETPSDPTWLKYLKEQDRLRTE